jgi:hypothetical protein
MRAVKLLEKAGKDGVLHLHIPVGQPGAEFEAVIVLQPQPQPVVPTDARERGWPPGYFEATFGSIDDETFVRPPQGELPPTVEFD